jgi:hypothetical protein
MIYELSPLIIEITGRLGTLDIDPSGSGKQAWAHKSGAGHRPWSDSGGDGVGKPVRGIPGRDDASKWYPKWKYWRKALRQTGMFHPG